MAIKWAPEAGTIVRADFTKFTVPEMTKIRPAVVISPRPQRRSKDTCLVVPLSTTPPKAIELHHALIQLKGQLPPGLKEECWVKGDMVYALSLKRLEFYRFGRVAGQRSYYLERLSPEMLMKARYAVKCAIGLTE